MQVHASSYLVQCHLQVQAFNTAYAFLVTWSLLNIIGNLPSYSNSSIDFNSYITVSAASGLAFYPSSPPPRVTGVENFSVAFNPGISSNDAFGALGM